VVLGGVNLLVMTLKYRKYLVLFIICCMILVATLGFKWIGKTLYPLNYQEHIIKYSDKYDIDPFLVAAIIRVESKYYTYAMSSKGAMGLMQILPTTGKWAAEEIGITNFNNEMLYNPEINIEIGCWYISKLLKQFNNNIRLIVAAYNGGSGNVSKWLNDPEYSSDGKNLNNIPFKETDQYVEKVIKSYEIYKKLYDIEDFK